MPSANKHFIWVKLDAVNLGTDKDIYVCCLYLPPSNSEYLKTQDIDIFYLLRSDIIKYSIRGNLIEHPICRVDNELYDDDGVHLNKSLGTPQLTQIQLFVKQIARVNISCFVLLNSELPLGVLNIE